MRVCDRAPAPLVSRSAGLPPPACSAPRPLPLQATARDNTGERQFVEDSVFPTLRFPSDHGIVSTELTWRK